MEKDDEIKVYLGLRCVKIISDVSEISADVGPFPFGDRRAEMSTGSASNIGVVISAFFECGALGGESSSPWPWPGARYRGAEFGELESGIAGRTAGGGNGDLRCGRWQLIDGVEHKIRKRKPREIGVNENNRMFTATWTVARPTWQTIWNFDKKNI